MVCEHTASLRAHGVRMAIFKLWSAAALMLQWRSEWSCFHRHILWNFFFKLAVSSIRESWQITFTKDKLLRSPYAWQGHWIRFSMTLANQNPLTVTGISCCDFDTSQYHSYFDEAHLTDGQRWQVGSDDSKVVREALKRPGRGLSPLGKAIMTLLSLSLSIALHRPSISITSRLPANDRKCW